MYSLEYTFSSFVIAMLVIMDDPPEPCVWRGEDRSRENSEGWRSGFLSEIGRVPASDAEADWDTGPLRSEPGLVDSRLVGYNCGQISRRKDE